VSGAGGGVSAAGMRGIAGKLVPGVIISTSTRARNGPRTVSVMAGEKSGSLRRRRSRPVPETPDSGPQGGGASPVTSRAPTLRARNSSRVGERGHMRAGAVAWSFIFTNTKTWRSPNHVSWGPGFRGDSVGTDASARQARFGTPDPPRNVAIWPATAGGLRRPRARRRWGAVSRRNHLHQFKGGERARTVSVTAEEKLGSY
jgi:hypothetical protein